MLLHAEVIRFIKSGVCGKKTRITFNIMPIYCIKTIALLITYKKLYRKHTSKHLILTLEVNV